jgi:hypothetical protein
VALMGSLSQIVGVIVAGVGGLLVWSPWSLVIAGGILVVAPEVGELVRRR